jgi:hypothetical protein
MGVGEWSTDIVVGGVRAVPGGGVAHLCTVDVERKRKEKKKTYFFYPFSVD